MELSCEVRGPLWVPRKVRARPFKRTSPEAEPTWLEPESAAAKGPSGRGISESVPGGRSGEREKGLGSCAEAGAGGSSFPKSAFMPQPFLPFPDNPPTHTFFTSLLLGLTTPGNNRSLSPAPSPAFLS